MAGKKKEVETIAPIKPKATKSEPVIKPTIGRVVLYNDGKSDQPCAAQIAYVHNDSCINISYIDQFGNSLKALNVKLNDTQDTPLVGECGWMPYQMEQAKK